MIEVEVRAFDDEYEQFEPDYFLAFLEKLGDIDTIKYKFDGMMIKIYGFSLDEVNQALKETRGVEYYE